MFSAIGCSNGAAGSAPGADGEGGNSWVGGQQGAGEWGNSERGVKSGGGVSSTSRDRTPHLKYKSPKQFELKQSRKALRALNARWALTVCPVFEDEKSKASDEKSVKRKIEPTRSRVALRYL